MPLPSTTPPLHKGECGPHPCVHRSPPSAVLKLCFLQSTVTQKHGSENSRNKPFINFTFALFPVVDEIPCPVAMSRSQPSRPGHPYGGRPLPVSDPTEGRAITSMSGLFRRPLFYLIMTPKCKSGDVGGFMPVYCSSYFTISH